MDSAVGNVELVGGNCNVGEALYQCSSKLFTADTTGRSRVLIVLMAGRAQEDLGIKDAADALNQVGVKIIAVGMGSSFDRAQLQSMAFATSYVLNTSSFGGFASITEKVIGLVSQGK